MPFRFLKYLSISLFLISCKQFSPSEVELEILKEANVNLSKITENSEDRISRILGEMQHNIKHKGYREADLEVMIEGIRVYRNYKKNIAEITQKSVKFNFDSLPLLDHSYFKEIDYSSEFIYYNNIHLACIESYYTEKVLQKFSEKFGVGCMFNFPELMIVKGEEIVYVLLGDQCSSSFFHEKIYLPKQYKNSYSEAEFNIWPEIEFIGNNQPVSADFRDGLGNKYTRTFKEFKTIYTFQ